LGIVGVAPYVRYWVDLQPVPLFCCYDNIAPRVLAIGARDSIAAKAANAKYQLVHACVRFVPGSFKAKLHYAIWSQTGPKLVADLLARASSLLAS